MNWHKISPKCELSIRLEYICTKLSGNLPCFFYNYKVSKWMQSKELTKNENNKTEEGKLFFHESEYIIFNMAVKSE